MEGATIVDPLLRLVDQADAAAGGERLDGVDVADGRADLLGELGAPGLEVRQREVEEVAVLRELAALLLGSILRVPSGYPSGV